MTLLLVFVSCHPHRPTLGCSCIYVLTSFFESRIFCSIEKKSQFKYPRRRIYRVSTRSRSGYGTQRTVASTVSHNHELTTYMWKTRRL
jgi:hypothetical protein